jgi:hypothetical protein
MGTFDDLKLDDHYLHFTFMVVILVVLSGIIEIVIHLVSRVSLDLIFLYFKYIYKKRKGIRSNFTRVFIIH